MSAKKSMGFGFDSLFADQSDIIESLVSDEPLTGDKMDTLSLSQIEPNENQARKNFDREALEELATSIMEHGVITPLIVRPIEGGRYSIIAGERRWRASRMAGLNEVPVIIRKVSDATAAQISLIENLQREDLNPIEEAMGYRQLGEEHNLTQEEISRSVGKSRSAVANAMRLLTLPDEVIEMVKDARLSPGHARALIPLGEKAVMAAQKVVKYDLSVRQTERLVKDITADPKPQRPKTDYEMQIESLENELQQTLGRKVKISGTGKHGRISIDYYDNDDLDALLSYLMNRNL